MYRYRISLDNQKLFRGTKMKKAYSYTRVSTEIQIDGYSLDAQDDAIERYAKANDIQIVKKFSDEGKSGKNITGRESFRKMLEDAKSGKDGVKTIIVFKISRFGRNASDVLSTVQDLQDYNINVVCVSEGIDSSNDSGKLLLALMSSIAEMERENIIVQTMAGRMQKARDGRWNGGQAPYGYKIGDKGVLEIVPEEAKAVKLIFKKYTTTDLGYVGVTKYLRDAGVKKSARQNGKLVVFQEDTVKKILSNPTYCGKIRYGKSKTEKIIGKRGEYRRVQSDDYILVEGKHKPIIDEKTFKTAQEKIKINAKRRVKIHNVGHEYLFSSILRCPVCGSAMYGNVSRKKNKDGSLYKDYYFYQCKHRIKVDNEPCSYKTHIREELVNGAVFQVLYKLMAEKGVAEEFKEQMNRQVDTKAIEEEIIIADKNVRSLNLLRDRINSQLDNLDYTESNADMKEADLNKRLEDCYSRLLDAQKVLDLARRKLEVAKEEQFSIEKSYEMLKQFGGRFDAMTDAQKKKFVQVTFKRIEIFPDFKEQGQLLKSIDLMLPLYWHGTLTNKISLDKSDDVETVVLMSKVK